MHLKGMVPRTAAFIWSVFVISALTFTAIQAASVPLTKTGQATCYDDAGSEINCAHTGQDGELQMGVAWSNPRFIDNGNGTVLDTLTNLIWTKDSQKIKGTKRWTEALDACNNLDFAGHTDWRLPNVKELISLLDYEQHDPALPSGHPFDNTQYLFYWSSTTYDSITNHAWGVYVCNGYVFNYHKATHAYVWAVRGGR